MLILLVAVPQINPLGDNEERNKRNELPDVGVFIILTYEDIEESRRGEQADKQIGRCIVYFDFLAWYCSHALTLSHSCHSALQKTIFFAAGKSASTMLRAEHPAQQDGWGKRYRIVE